MSRPEARRQHFFFVSLFCDPFGVNCVAAKLPLHMAIMHALQPTLGFCSPLPSQMCDTTGSSSSLEKIAGHHADVGGITSGSMPPASKRLVEEGAAIVSFKLVKGGKFQVCSSPADPVSRTGAVFTLLGDSSLHPPSVMAVIDMHVFHAATYME